MTVLFLEVREVSNINWLFGWAKENGIEIPIDYEGRADIGKLLEIYRENTKSKFGRRSASEISLDKREYSVLKKEVMRKNAEQKGKVKPTNFAYTSNKFYVYITKGDDDFTPIVQLDIEEEGAVIDMYEELMRGKK